MFGIDDVLLASLIGGGAGALLNKKNPLNGALLGAGLGAGGASLPGLLGASGAAGGVAGGTGIGGGALGGVEAGGLSGANLLGNAAPSLGFNASGFLGGTSTLGGIGGSGLGYAAPAITSGSGFGAGAGGMLGALETANKAVQPVMKGVEAAQMFQQDDRPPELMMPSPLMSPPQYGPQSLTQLAGQNEQYNLTQAMQDFQERQKRKQRIGSMGLL